MAETIIAALQVRDGSTWAARVLGVFATRMDLEKADELLNQVVNHPSPE